MPWLLQSGQPSVPSASPSRVLSPHKDVPSTTALACHSISFKALVSSFNNNFSASFACLMISFSAAFCDFACWFSVSFCTLSPSLSVSFLAFSTAFSVAARPCAYYLYSFLCTLNILSFQTNFIFAFQSSRANASKISSEAMCHAYDVVSFFLCLLPLSNNHAHRRPFFSIHKFFQCLVKFHLVVCLFQ